MRKVLFFFILLAVCFSANAQKKKASVKRELIIANEELNVLYRGYDNKLIISVTGIQSSDLILSSEGATFTREGDFWICRVTSNNSEVAIYVSANIKNKTELIGSKTYRVRTLQNPVAYIKLENGDLWTADKGPIDKLQFKGASVVAELGPNDIINTIFTVTSFKLMISDGKDGYIKISSDGNKFSNEQINAINKLSPGSTISLSNIEFTGAKSGKNLPFAPVTLK